MQTTDMGGFMAAVGRARAAIWDLDGTLLDSMGLWERIDREFFASRGLTMEADYGAKVAAMSFAEAAAYTVEHYHLQQTPQAISREWQSRAEAAYATTIPLKPGARGLLRMLKRQGLALAVATALSPCCYTPALKRLGVYDCFIYATVEEAGRGKSEPDVFLLAAKKLGVAPDRCLVLEDTLEGVRAAKRVGMATVAVRDGNLWQAELKKEADFYLPDFLAFAHEEDG